MSTAAAQADSVERCSCGSAAFEDTPKALRNARSIGCLGLGEPHGQAALLQPDPDALREAAGLLSVGERRNDGKLGAPELAAYSVTASLLLNLDEVITKQ